MKFSYLKKQQNIILAAIAVILAFGIGINVGERLERGESDSSAALKLSISSDKEPLDLEPFWKAYSTLNDKFVATTASSSNPSDQDKVWGAIQGLAEAYGDPYTVFFPPKESKSFSDEVRGDFQGVGMEIGIKEKVLTVVAPLKGTPAEQAGIIAGDLILKIDKKNTLGMSVEDAVSLIRGPKGTTVHLLIKHNDDEARELAVTRDTIAIPTIDTKLRDDGVFVISLYNFSANSPTLFRGALREFIQSGSDKLILDLRGNPGGYLEAAVDMASFFLPMGDVVVREDFGKGRKEEVTKSLGYNIFTDRLKMVVLIDEGSASASEILSGALHEHRIAKLVGQKSFGKGSVQELVDITPETSLKVTIARWLTPNGTSISENGITPDVVVAISKDDIKKKNDSQMEKAAQILLDPSFTR